MALALEQVRACLSPRREQPLLGQAGSPQAWLAEPTGPLLVEGRAMRTHRWTKRFLKRCPLCQEVVQDGAAGVVRCLGRLYCCQAHADRDEASLYRSLQAFHRRHAAQHGSNRLLPAAVLPHAGKDHIRVRRRTIATSHAQEAPP
jgi:hypothetical protein